MAVYQTEEKRRRMEEDKERRSKEGFERK